jgi:hypothetical protein
MVIKSFLFGIFLRENSYCFLGKSIQKGYDINCVWIIERIEYSNLGSLNWPIKRGIMITSI